MHGSTAGVSAIASDSKKDVLSDNSVGDIADIAAQHFITDRSDEEEDLSETVPVSKQVVLQGLD